MKRRVVFIVGGLLTVLLALWGGAFGWQFIDNTENAFAIAMIYTQLLMVIGGGALAIVGAVGE